VTRMRAVIFAILALSGAIFLVQLGFWQLNRLAWKEALISQMQAAIDGQGVDLTPEQAAARFMEDEWADYVPVKISGQYVGSTQWLYAIVDGRPGWHAVDLLERPDGLAVLVDRGALPNDAREMVTRPDGPVEFRGLARRPQPQAGAFQPESKPESREFFWRDVEAMAEGTPIHGFLVEKLPQADDRGWPRALVPDPKSLPNNHFDYALTWFSLAALLLGLTAFFLWTKRKLPENQPHA
jgi:surfeit locus 1 family protein